MHPVLDRTLNDTVTCYHQLDPRRRHPSRRTPTLDFTAVEEVATARQLRGGPLLVESSGRILILKAIGSVALIVGR